MEQKVQPSRPWLGAVVALVITAALLAVLMLWRPTTLYLWLKALHIIAVIAWMAGMLYLPRLFVYHCEAEPGSKQSETFKVMERRLLTAIINPAMVATWVLGLWLAWDAGLFRSRLAAREVRAGARDVGHARHVRALRPGFRRTTATGTRSDSTESSTKSRPLLMIGIVILVVVKPF